NAGEWTTVPSLQEDSEGELELGSIPAPDPTQTEDSPEFEGSEPGEFNSGEEPFGEPEEPDDSNALFGAAYENVVFRDSAQDGQAGDTVDDGKFALDTDLDLISQPLESRLRFLVTLSQAWGSVADWLTGGNGTGQITARTAETYVPSPDQLEALRHWEKRNDSWLSDLGVLMDELANWEPLEPEGDPDSLVEFDRQSHVKFGLLNSVISAGVALSDTSRVMKSLPTVAPASGRRPDVDELSLLVMRHIARRDATAVKNALPTLLKHLTRRPLLYVPIDRGGRPRDIMASRNLQSLIRMLLNRLPQLGLFREAFQVLRTAYVMERTSPPNGMSITEFDRLLEAALHSTLTTIVSGTDAHGQPLSDDTILTVTARLLEAYMQLWLKHSATMRLSSIEVLKDQAMWRKVKSFVKKYGSDLFHPRMLSMGNLRGIVQRGAESYLDYLSENEDPLHPVKLLEDLDRTISRGEAAYILETILRCIIEKFDRFLEYNTTTTHSDYGEQLHSLLDFLRHEADYERQAWNIAPMELAHEIISRQGRISAADRWRDDLEAKTAPLAKQHLAKLKRLEKKYGMRLPGVSDRLSERFVKPLALDRILARVKPALRDSRAGNPSPDFDQLQIETEEYLSTTMGSALELLPWLQTLEEEVQDAEAATMQSAETLLLTGQAPKSMVIDIADLERQLNDLDKPLQDD
ncbi:MAG: hypothetical protein JSS02_25410, partial [Planctomycetes bacterium]|nr:hypothetical protein [Planctomycetota bacterium]